MAKETRKISGSVRLGGTLYKAGDEDKLEKVLSETDAERLTEKGVISGFTTKQPESKEEPAKAGGKSKSK